MNRNRYLVTLLKLVNIFEIVVSILLIAGVIVEDGEYIYQIVKMATGGVIETVSIEKIDDKKEKNK